MISVYLHFSYALFVWICAGFIMERRQKAGKMGFTENEAILKRDVKIFNAEDVMDARERRKNVCKKCIYRAFELNSTNSNAIVYGNTCNYIIVEGHIRPCAPSNCVDAGIFIKGDRITKPRKATKTT